MQVAKVFQVVSGSLEKSLNEWLEKNPNIEIIQCFQSQSMNSIGYPLVTFTVLYKEAQVKGEE